jgi:hypothetical protein
MTKQTPEKFAKNVLWQLAGIRAELDQLLSARVIELSDSTGVAPTQVRQTMSAQISAVRKFLYEEMVDEADLR